MIILIHGNDVSASLTQMDRLLTGAEWVLRLDALKSTGGQFDEAFSSQGLFAEKKTIVIENLFKLPPKKMDELLQFVVPCRDSREITAILTHDDLISPAKLTKVPAVHIHEYMMPKVFFAFLDGLKPGNGVRLSALFNELLKTSSGEMVFYSTIKRVRLLLMCKADNAHTLQELAKMNDWQRRKMLEQARAWTREELIEFYKKLFELEREMKTSSLSLPLAAHVDILFLSLSV